MVVLAIGIGRRGDDIVEMLHPILHKVPGLPGVVDDVPFSLFRSLSPSLYLVPGQRLPGLLWSLISESCREIANALDQPNILKSIADLSTLSTVPQNQLSVVVVFGIILSIRARGLLV